jgi:FtsP/CotA-like multicopper oxidase with cupredoxin domain
MLADGLPTPEVRVSVDGVLETTLRASYGEVEINGQKVQTLNFEGMVPGPTLVVCPGDTLIVHLENALGDTPDAWMAAASHDPDVPHGEGQVTNLHTHGFHVSPDGNSDNVFLSIPPGLRYTYEYRIPEDHPPGLYWYHPHRHGFVNPHIYAGMAGAIYVQGGLDTSPGFAEIPTRTMVFQRFEVADGIVVNPNDANAEKMQIYLNGVLEPEIAIRPGQVQRWQVVNANANEVMKVTLTDHEFHILANDGNTLASGVTVDTLLLGPGERREVLVVGGQAGEYALMSQEFTARPKASVAAQKLATLRSAGDPAADKLPDLSSLATLEDLRDAEVSTRHRIVYTSALVDGEPQFYFNGALYRDGVVNEVMILNEVAEWVLVNETDEWHTFHIHINDFQVIGVELNEVEGVTSGGVVDTPPGSIDLEDTVKLPPRSTVVMRTRPTDFTGTYVYHCHMVFHEDRGMMGVVEVVES